MDRWREATSPRCTVPTLWLSVSMCSLKTSNVGRNSSRSTCDEASESPSGSGVKRSTYCIQYNI